MNKKELFVNRVSDKLFPCIAARSALKQGNIYFIEANHIACPHDDAQILQSIYKFIDIYRRQTDEFNSAVVIFDQPTLISEEQYELFMWQRLQALHELDRVNYKYDKRVEADPGSENFSFSLKEEAFFIIGLHPANVRPARRFDYPAIVFNPHAQFEQLRTENRYEKIKSVVRKRDELVAGSVNPMLTDYGTRSEAFQYSGKAYDKNWKCPLHINNHRAQAPAGSIIANTGRTNVQNDKEKTIIYNSTR